MIKAVKRAWKAFKESAPVEPPVVEVHREPGAGLRYSTGLWQAADTDRLNAVRWSPETTCEHINADMARQLDDLVRRCRKETYNNPLVAGVINTHSVDLITPSGPTLKVLSENEDFNRIVLEEWNKWWRAPEISGEISGVELMRRWNEQEWVKGDVFALYVNSSREPAGEITLRLMDLDPNRVRTPVQLQTDRRIALGVQRDRVGRPVRYFVERVNTRSEWCYNSQVYDRYSADDMLHAFQSHEPGQTRGFPRLSYCLDEISQLRDYDQAVLDASKVAAEFAAVATTSNDDIIEAAGNRVPQSSISLERQTIKHMVPGWEVQGLQPTQPQTQYTQFRHEKLRALGRPVHMPLLLILLSAEQSNFSQSRIDVNVFYQRGLRAQQFQEEHRKLNPMFWRFYQELRLLQRNGQFVIPDSARVPDTEFRIEWHWEALPQADELKHWQAKQAKRQLGLTTPSTDAAEEGNDFAILMAQLSQDQQTVQESGVALDVTASTESESQTETEAAGVE